MTTEERERAKRTHCSPDASSSTSICCMKAIIPLIQSGDFSSSPERSPNVMIMYFTSVSPPALVDPPWWYANAESA